MAQKKRIAFGHVKPIAGQGDRDKKDKRGTGRHSQSQKLKKTLVPVVVLCDFDRVLGGTTARRDVRCDGL